MAAQGEKSATLSLRIDPELEREAEKAVVADHRTLTSLIEQLLSDYLQALAGQPKAKRGK